ncbi:hypothetical protein [Streptomyces sp. 8L]|uniref:hypothetical protein n=1 Tax=Streptomyces sp. 8L TaxID=2877242 RepID=UPI001CD25111|nr:hypothetical protein [Streptomyces sp. 8L]MCA1221404.1 hypothetical protein [Streptomyces sp. 8L]
MAAKTKKDPAARRAREAARRASAAERIGPRPIRTPRPRTLYNLNPPGLYYQEWDEPTGTDEEVMNKVIEAFGADSGEATTMRLMLEYRHIYGPHIPFAAAGHLDLILRDTDLAASLAESAGSPTDDVRKSLHSLHAQGMLLVRDDGALWMTVPPGTPYSAAGGQWAFVEQKVAAPA